MEVIPNMRDRHSQLPPEAVEGREQEFGLNIKRKKTPRYHEAQSDATSSGFQPAEDQDARSRYLAANNRNFGVNLGVVFNFVSK